LKLIGAAIAGVPIKDSLPRQVSVSEDAMRKFWIGSPVWFALALFAADAILAQEQQTQQRIALTAAPENDPEFELMGEFVGPVTVGENQYEPLGLQVRPLGNDRFEGLQYAGGLPGQTTYGGGEPVQLVGRRSGDFVVLSGGPYAIFVESDSCLLIDRKGSRIGRLERVQRVSPTMGVMPPEYATVLFDGSGLEQFTSAQMTEDGLLKHGADVKPMFQDFDLHVEFRLPYMPFSDGQARGNSGCYLQSRYEVQVLDSFAQLPVFNGCSSLYRFKSPDLNMCLPPLRWQTYDIRFTAARWAADGTKIRNARITVWHNGVKTQDDVELPNKTGAGKEEAPTLLPIRFQNHGDPVRFRNIWIVDRGLGGGEFPRYPVLEEAVPEEATPEGAAPAVAEASVEQEPKVETTSDAETSSEAPSAEEPVSIESSAEEQAAASEKAEQEPASAGTSEQQSSNSTQTPL
jgi:hypothetical protein